MLTDLMYLQLCEKANDHNLNKTDQTELCYISKESIDQWVIHHLQRVKEIVVVIWHKENHQEINDDQVEAMLSYVKSIQSDREMSITGMGMGGVMAAKVGSEMGVKAVVFRAYLLDERDTKIRNIIPQSDPITGHPRTTVYAKEGTISQEDGDSLSKKLVFDEGGYVVADEQNQYGKFCHWVYTICKEVDDNIWQIFFKDSEKPQLINDKDLYLVYLKAKELNQLKVDKAIIQVMNHINKRLLQEHKAMNMALSQSLEEETDEPFMEYAIKLAETTAKKSIKITTESYNSVETILIGINIYSMSRGDKNYSASLNAFSKAVEGRLTRTKTDILTLLQQAKTIKKLP